MKYLILLTFLNIFGFNAFSQDRDACFDPDCMQDSLIINTGYDHINNTAIPIGQPDPYWELVTSPNTTLSIPTPAWTINKNSAWTNAPANSQWISAYNYPNWNFVNRPPDQPYTFQFCFCVCEGVDSIEINMDIFVDNTVKIYFDGDSIFNSAFDNAVSNFQQGESISRRFAVKPGEHCIRAEMRNWTAVAMGLLIKGSIKSVVPDGHDGKPVLLSQVCCNPNGSIFGRKINDKNCNGKDDNTPNNPNVEPGMGGWEIVLNPGNITTTTDANGFYYFNNLPPGTYTVSEVQQPGWSQTLPTTSSYTITLNPKDIVQLDFANCQKPAPPCDEMGEGTFDEDCCQLSFALSNSIGNITNIKYYVTGGVMEDLTIFPCPYTTNPANVTGSTSGTISYSTPCNDIQQFIVKANATNASGLVNIRWVVYHEGGDSCVYDTRIQCERAPLERCDRLNSRPTGWKETDMPHRVWEIYNNKIPVSPICSVKVETNPVSTINGFWLNSDGMTPTMSGAIWNSPYNSIDFSATPVNNHIIFNTNFDGNVNWTGMVNITVYHCDGDSCNLSYRVRRKYVVDGVIDHLVRPRKILDSLIVLPIELNLEELMKNNDSLVLQSISIKYLQGVKSIEAISATKENNSEKEYDAGFIESSSILNDVTAFYKIKDSGRIKRLDKSTPLLYQVCIIEDDSDYEEYIFEWSLYDDEGTEFASGLDSIPIDDVSNVGKSEVKPFSGSISIENVTPNPINDLAKIHYLVKENAYAELCVYDLLGNKVSTIKSGVFAPGYYTIDFDTSKLSQGTYILNFSNSRHSDTFHIKIQR